MLYFSYGANLNKRGMARRCPAAKPLGVAKLENHKLCFKRYADIIPAPGSLVMGAVWELTAACVRALDAYEGDDYARIQVSVTMDGKTVAAMAYAMTTDAPLAPPSMDYARELEVGYRDWGLDETALRRARYDTLHVGPGQVGPGAKQTTKQAAPQRRSVLWDPARNQNGALDALSRPLKKR
jgi:gamma-glutamylcyclotransferase (GGCT)/AIG2-like uncharacterized protein YtfP